MQKLKETMDDKKIIVITGCSSGIGLETAVLLAKDKGVKIIASMRNLEKRGPLEKAAGGSLNTTMIIKELDISKEDSIVNFVKNTIAEEGKIDVLINNAAMGQFGIFESVSMKQMQALFQTNVFGTARITQEVVPHMKKRKSGHIIFISSILGLRPFPLMDFYVASKFAIEGLVGNLAPVLRCFNISVTSVEPGPVKTSIGDNIPINGQGGLEVLNPTKSRDSGDETDALLKTFMEKYFPVFCSNGETMPQVTQVIKDCIYQTKPPVRIQPSDAILKMAKEVQVDPTGNQITDELEAFFK